MEVDKSIKRLIDSGASISKENLRKLRNYILNNQKRHIELVLQELMEELSSYTFNFLETGVINGINTSICLDQIDLNMYGAHDIVYDTEFDIASITKLFTLILVFKFIDKGILKSNDRICDIDNHFPYLDYTVDDLIKMCGHIVTDERIDEASSKEEAIKRLYRIHPVDYNKEVNNYTDIGFMVLAKIIENITNQSFDEVIKNFYLDYGILVNQKKHVVGNGHPDFLPHDPKARMMGGCIGSSGIFINNVNMQKMAYRIFDDRNFITENNLLKLSKKIFDNNHANKGIAGIYIKHPLGIKKSSTPNEYSKYAFSHQGYTGSCIILDPYHRIYNGIMVDAIKENQKKDDNFYKYFNNYHEKLIFMTLKVYLIQECLNPSKVKIIQKI